MVKHEVPSFVRCGNVMLATVRDPTIQRLYILSAVTFSHLKQFGDFTKDCIIVLNEGSTQASFGFWGHYFGNESGCTEGQIVG
jgi:hypothetical protein